VKPSKSKSDASTSASCTPESEETPEQESRSHSPAFLRRAAHLAEKKPSKRSPKRRR
jgi:hypothetical protein